MPCDRNASPAALATHEGDHPTGTPTLTGDGVARTANTVSGTGVCCALPAELIGAWSGSVWAGVAVGCRLGALDTGVNSSSNAASALWFIASTTERTSCTRHVGKEWSEKE
jgi:hypothetical protein